MNEAESIETIDQSDITSDYDWDSDVEDFPAIEEGNDESNSDEDVESAESGDVEVSGKEASKESNEDASKVESAKDEDKGGESETAEEDSETLSLSEFDDDALISVKVDGVTEEISIKDFKSGISGQLAIEKRFSEFDKTEKAYKQEVAEINSFVNTFAQKMQSGEPVDALEYLTTFTDIPAYDVKDMLIKSLMPEIVRRQELSEDQLQFEKNQEKLKFDTDKNDADRVKYDNQQAQRELDHKLVTARQSHNISEDVWNDAFKKLDESLPKHETITIDSVKEYVLFNRASDALSAIDSNLISNKEIMDSFVNVQKENPDFTSEDLAIIAQDAFSNAEKEQIEGDLQEATQSKQGKGNAKQIKEKDQPGDIQPEKNSTGDEIDDWDDLL